MLLPRCWRSTQSTAIPKLEAKDMGQEGATTMGPSPGGTSGQKGAVSHPSTMEVALDTSWAKLDT